MIRKTMLVALLAALACLLPRPGHALGVADLDGHLSIGYARLLVADAPGGSMSFAGGVDAPLPGPFRVGVDVGYSLLGSRTVERGSLAASLDYNLFEAVLFGHWFPSRLGPVERVSFGPALLSARAELSTSGVGASFSDLPVEDVAGGLALDVTLMKRAPAPVRVGLELGGRIGFVERQNWTLVNARVAFHY
jgi:hypothetical protein